MGPGKLGACDPACPSRRYPDAKVINFGTWFIFSFPIAVIMLVLTWLWLHFLFLGCKWVESRCSPRLPRSRGVCV